MMKLSLDALLVLDAIDRKGSFAAAADELHRVPSAISYTVGKLETDLGVSLFDRSGRRPVLSAAGRHLLENGRVLLEAAHGLERQVLQMEEGWETSLSIAVSDLVPMAALAPVLQQFYALGTGTELHLGREVYGGSWDTLISGRAQVSIGAPAEGPPGGGYSAVELGEVRWVFAVSPSHPLANAPEPIPEDMIRRHLALSAADSSRTMAPRTSGLLAGQQVLSLPDMETKREMHIAGVGAGYLPDYMIEQDVSAGRLQVKQTVIPKPLSPVVLAWQTRMPAGRAQSWFVEILSRCDELRALLRPKQKIF